MTLQPDGLAGKIAALGRGKSLSLTLRIPVRNARPDEEARDARAFLKNKMAPHVARAKAHTAYNYRTETSVTLSHDYAAILVSIAITRI